MCSDGPGGKSDARRPVQEAATSSWCSIFMFRTGLERGLQELLVLGGDGFRTHDSPFLAAPRHHDGRDLFSRPRPLEKLDAFKRRNGPGRLI